MSSAASLPWTCPSTQSHATYVQLAASQARWTVAMPRPAKSHFFRYIHGNVPGISSDLEQQAVLQSRDLQLGFIAALQNK
jgi:hypothetical protein